MFGERDENLVGESTGQEGVVWWGKNEQVFGY